MANTKITETTIEMTVGWVQVRRGKNPRQGESLDKTKTKQTVQLRTSKIHKTRRQAGGSLLGFPMIFPCEHLFLLGFP